MTYLIVIFVPTLLIYRYLESKLHHQTKAGRQADAAVRAGGDPQGQRQAKHEETQLVAAGLLEHHHDREGMTVP